MNFFRVGDVGHWGGVDRQLCGKGGIWVQIFAGTHGASRRRPRRDAGTCARPPITRKIDRASVVFCHCCRSAFVTTHHSTGSRSALSSPLVLPVLLPRGGSLGLVVCSSSKIPAATGEAGKLKELLVTRHSVTPSANDRILPRRFAAVWKAKSGQELKIRISSRGSGTQAGRSSMGWRLISPRPRTQPALLKRQKAGLIQPGWEQELCPAAAASPTLR